jgi:hypothetical protein
MTKHLLTMNTVFRCYCVSNVLDTTQDEQPLITTWLSPASGEAPEKIAQSQEGHMVRETYCSYLPLFYEISGSTSCF